MTTRTRLQEIRNVRGFSAAGLAHAIGVSRQTIYAIEDGSFVPNTAISLKLARVLDVQVEELFSIAEDESAAIPFSVPRNANSLLLAGCDPALSVLNDLLRASQIEVVTVPCSSRRALKWLKQGLVHTAGSHLRDRSTGEYNLPIISRTFPEGSVKVMTFACWEEGLVLPRGNPRKIRSLADLGRKGLTLINREKGSGSRYLLDDGLRKAGIDGKRIKGYLSAAPGHLPAAYAVAAGTADCCVATRSASRHFELDFVPLAVERFDLSFHADSWELPAARALADLLNRSGLRKKLQTMAGYDTAQTGQLLI